MPLQIFFMRVAFISVFALTITLIGCGPTPQEREAAARVAAEAQVAPLRATFDDARKQGDWSLALVQAEAILQKAPFGDAAQHVKHFLAEVKEKATQQSEKRRLHDLWLYQMQRIDGHSTPQRTATVTNFIENTSDDEDAQSVTFEPISRVRLVLRDDPRWGKSTFLIIDQGNFSCGAPCRFFIAIDDGKPQRFDGRTSSTGSDPALFINDDERFVKALTGAQKITVAPATGTSAALIFETGGFDPTRWAAGR